MTLLQFLLLDLLIKLREVDVFLVLAARIDQLINQQSAGDNQ
jgi:hypothetical protein